MLNPVKCSPFAYVDITTQYESFLALSTLGVGALIYHYPPPCTRREGDWNVSGRVRHEGGKDVERIDWSGWGKGCCLRELYAHRALTRSITFTIYQ
jgi:hypothetical protein